MLAGPVSPTQPLHRKPRRHLRRKALHETIDHAVSLSSAIPALTELPKISSWTLLGDAASTADTVDAVSKAMQSPSWLKPWTDFLELVLQNFQQRLEAAGIPYSYGWSIVLLTAFVKAITYPLTKQQVESSLKMQRLKPGLDKIKERYERSPDIIEREKQVLYEEYDVNPSATLFPTLATIPIFLGLFYSLRNVAARGALDDQGFFFIPTLSGPVSFADRQAGVGLQWLYPFVDGHPPIGWETAWRYLVLPVSLVFAQIISSKVLASINEKTSKELEMQDWAQAEDEDSEKSGESPRENEEEKDEKNPIAEVLGYVLPLVIGYFSLNVPSGLALYYLSNTLITSALQLYLREYGGAELDELDFGEIPPGYGIRTGEPVPEDDGDMTPEEEAALVPEWLPKALDGDEDAWPIYQTLQKEYQENARKSRLYSWSAEIPLSEFSEEVENAGNPLETCDEPYPEWKDMISTGEIPSEYDDLFNDPDFR